MKITRLKLREMIEEEVRAALTEKGKSKKPKKASADTEDSSQVQPPGGGPDPIQSAPPIDGGLNDDDEDGFEDEDGDGVADQPPDPTDGEGPDDGEAIDGKDPSDFDPNELKMGAEHELEHTDDPKKALEIAMDHLTEDPHYYSDLKAAGRLFSSED